MKSLPRSIPVYGFTTKHNGIARVLKNKITISEAYDPQSGLPKPDNKEYIGIWDTGATGTVINSKIIRELKLKPSGQTICKAVGSGGKTNEYLTNTFSINVVLPNKVTIIDIVASEGEIGDDADVLLGMDIISSGDFAVSNFDGKTMLSFRIPSEQEIDFVKEINERKLKQFGGVKIGRNDPCPCGSGKKYKHCHGR